MLDSIEYQVTSKDAQVRNLLIGGQLPDGGFIATFTDITLIREAEAAQSGRDAADAANAAKSPSWPT